MERASLTRSSINTKSNSNLNPDSVEFGYLSGYYLRLNCQNNIVITAYNLETLDGERYDAQMNQLFLHKLSEKFKNLNAINNIYSYIVKLIKEDNFKIINSPPNIILVLQVKEDIQNSQEIKIILSNNNRKYGNFKYIQEYLGILTNEIKRIKNSGSIIEKLENENKKLKKEISDLKNIIASNSGGSLRTDKNIYSITLDDFNNKFELKIPNNNIKKLDLDNLNLGNEIIDYLSVIELPVLEKLYLANDDISDIKNLEYLDFKNLQKLSLVDNKISDITPLGKCHFQNLKELHLYNNNIININPLENSSFTKLQILSLGNNKISTIIFSKLNFVDLKELYLYNNSISDINTLSQSDFKNLEKLALNNNAIEDISPLEKVNFKNLKELWLYNNNISNINVFAKVKFFNLEVLSLSNNKIDNIKILEKCDFRMLKKLDLGGNKIDDITVLSKVNFNDLKELYLFNKNIDNIKILEKAKFEK